MNVPGSPRHKSGLIVLFGSGELTSVGRKIQEEVFRRAGLARPVTIGILETPTGFEVNAIRGWPERCQRFFEKHLSNYHPIVTRIQAWRNIGRHSTNDAAIVDALLTQDFIYCGAGSPTYVVRHLKGTRAIANLLRAHKHGAVLCFGSATAIAAGAWALPVYEIFKAGMDAYWIRGLNIFGQYGLRLAVVPHWNNQEGDDFDSTRCWMGRGRFANLRSILSPGATILGIDETTAVLIDVVKREITVLGTGNAYVSGAGKAEQTLKRSHTYPLAILQ